MSTRTSIDVGQDSGIRVRAEGRVEIIEQATLRYEALATALDSGYWLAAARAVHGPLVDEAQREGTAEAAAGELKAMQAREEWGAEVPEAALLTRHRQARARLLQRISITFERLREPQTFTSVAAATGALASRAGKGTPLDFDICRAWPRRGQRALLAAAVILLGLPASAVAAILAAVLAVDRAKVPSFVFALGFAAWALGTITCLTYYWRWPCPVCGAVFGTRMACSKCGHTQPLDA